MIELAYHPQGLQAADIGLMVLRVSVGGFFAISGYHKLFNRERHASLVATLKADHIPLVRVNEWFVPAVEFAAGMFLGLGLFSVVAAMLLAAICMVACLTDGLGRISAWKPLDRADYLDDLFYLPEMIYGVILLALILGGPGALSLDAALFSRV